MKNNGEKLEGLMIAAMLLIFVTSIWAFRDTQRMHEKLAEKVQQTPETAEFAEFVSHLLPATPETAEITPFDASDPHMNFVASKERLKLTLNSCVPLSLDDTTVCIPIQSIGERSLVSYQTQDHTACVGAYHMTLVNGHKEEGVNFLLINDSALISGTRNINEDTSLVVTALVKVNEEQQQTKVIQQLLDGAVLCDVAPTITIFGVPVKNNSMIEVDNALGKIETNQGRVFITSSATIKESKPLDESVVLPSGIEAKYNSTARTGSEDICKRVARDIFNQLWQVLRAEDTEPKSVYIDPNCHCNKLIFPDNPRQVTSAMRAAACGSRTNLPDGNVLRAFLYWKGNDGPNLWNGIDLDLSVVFYGEEKAKFIYYANPKDGTLGAVHSGDRRCSGKNGAVEYVDFDIKKCFQNGFRYAALTVKSYSGEKFSEMENAFCGVMVRDGKTGGQFEPATVKDRFALTTDSDQLVMVVIDLMTREVITVDKSVAQFRLSCRNVLTDYAPTVAVCTYAMQLKSLSIKEMLGMRYAQFLKGDDWKHASVIVSDEPEKFKATDKDAPAPRIVSPYDIPGIYDLIFGKENQ